MIEAISEKTIKILLNSSEPLTSKVIALEINVSESSVKHNIKNVRDILSSVGATLNSAPGKGFWIEADAFQKKKINNIINANKDKAYSFNYRRKYILEILYQTNSNYTLQIFADDLGVGKNIIVKDLENIEKWLGFFDVEIVRIRNKGIQMKGGEFNIRQAIIYSNTAFMDNIEMDLDRPDILDFRISKTFYNYFKKMYPKNDIYYIEDILLEVERELDIRFEDVSFIQLMEYICVSANRIKEGCLIIENNILNNCKISLPVFNVAKNVISKLAKDIQGYLMIEIHCMAAQFTIYGAYDVASGSLIKEEYYEELAREFIEYLQKIIVNKKILVSNNLIEDMSLLFRKKKILKSYQIINSNYLKKDIKKQLPSLYAVVLANVEYLENKLKIKFTDNDIAYIVMLIDNAIEDTNDDLKTLLITSFDYNTRKYLENKIKRSIQHIKIEKVIHPYELKQEDVSKYELMITTVLLENSEALKVSRRVDTFDLDLIAKEVEKKRKEKQMIWVKEQKMFTEELILNNFKAKRKEEVLMAGAELLKEKGYVTDKFYDVLLERENFISTSMGNGIAIPHAFKTEIYETAVGVIKLERPILWNEGENVEVVFIIAIHSDESDFIYNFFARFYELMNDSVRLEVLKRANNEHEIFCAVEELGSVIHEGK